MSIRVFLVEDEPAVRRGLELLIGREPDLAVCAHASRQNEALANILEQKPDFAIIDLTLEEGSGLDLVRELRAFGAGLKILVFSMHTQVSQVRAALRAGANGYVTKEEGAENLIPAIRTIMGGHDFLTPATARSLNRAEAENGPP